MNPITMLLEDHEPLSEGVRCMGALLGRVNRGEASPQSVHRELLETIEHLRDELFEHFGIEEEVLFPFLQAEAPAVASAVARLEADHDQICGALLRIEHLASGVEAGIDTQLPRIFHVFERFEVAYHNHARGESELLLQVEETLGEPQLRRLAERMRGLA